MNTPTQTAEFQVWEMIVKGRGQSTLRLRTSDPVLAQRKAEAIVTPLNSKNFVYILFWPSGSQPTPSTVWDSLNGWHAAKDLRSAIRHLLRTR